MRHTDAAFRRVVLICDRTSWQAHARGPTWPQAPAPTFRADAQLRPMSRRGSSVGTAASLALARNGADDLIAADERVVRGCGQLEQRADLDKSRCLVRLVRVGPIACSLIVHALPLSPG